MAEVNYDRTGHRVTDRHTFAIHNLTYSKLQSYSKFIWHYCESSLYFHILEIVASSGDFRAGDGAEEAIWPQLHVCHSSSAQQSRILSRVPRHANTYVTLSQLLSRQEKVGSASNSSPLPSDSFYKIIIHLYSTIFIQPDLFKSF